MATSARSTSWRRGRRAKVSGPAKRGTSRASGGPTGSWGSDTEGILCPAPTPIPPRLAPVGTMTSNDVKIAYAPGMASEPNLAERGLTMVGVPEGLGGAVEKRSAVTAVLMSEALAQGDMGLAVACLAPAGVATALGLWGDADQQATYLPELVGDDPPTAALAILEPRALFDPFELQTRARRDGEGFVLEGAKALVPRAG